MNGFTFDTGALIALDRFDRRVQNVLARAAELDLRIFVPATALAQAMRRPARQTRLSRLIRDSKTDVIGLNAADATAVGILLAQTSTKDIVDAHVVICARRTGHVVLTSDAGDLRRLDPELEYIPI